MESNAMNLLVSSIVEFADVNDSVAAVYLFGSYARGREKKHSDVDIALMTFRETAGMKKIEWETELSNILGKDVDLVIFGQAETLL